MKILFIGGILPSDKLEDIIVNSKKNIDFAAHNFQKKIIDGLEKNNVDYYGLSVPFISSFPKYYKKVIIKNIETSKIRYLKFINIPLYKIISRYRTLKKALKQIKNDYNSEYNVIIYSLHYPFLKNAKYIKKINPNCKIALVVPDLQEYMSSRKSIVFSLLKKIEIKKTNRYLKYIDNFVFLTEYMNERINIENKPYEVIEGIANSYHNNIVNNVIEVKDKFLVYTGTLAERYGVMNLINAFLKTKNKEIKLVICGQGEKSDEIKKIANSNSRIIFKGLVSPEESLKIQHDAFALINPRPNNEEYTKYSFPSKILEYISTGKPVICYKLDGFPIEYDDILIYPNSNSIEDLANCIDDVFDYDFNSLERIMENSYNFLTKKNSESCVKKILKLFDN